MGKRRKLKTKRVQLEVSMLDAIVLRLRESARVTDVLQATSHHPNFGLNRTTPHSALWDVLERYEKT